MSLALFLEGARFAWSPTVPLLGAATAGADLHLGPGWTGLVGANGAGKSTLLRIVAGELPLDDGQRTVHPPGLAMLRTAQCPARCTAPIRAFGEAWDKAAVRWRTRLSMMVENIDRWDVLSPGERMRWQLAAALWTDPDVLLLDEPTNHMDAQGRALILRALERFRGIGIVVSHDRTLLDALTTHTLRLHRGQLRLWTGGYGQAQAQWTQQDAHQRAHHSSLRDQQRALARRMHTQRQHQAKAERMRSTRARQRNAGDTDARSALAKVKAARGAARQAHGAALLRRREERVQNSLSEAIVENNHRSDVELPYTPPPHAHVLSLDQDALQVDGHTLLRGGVRPVLNRGDKVWLSGPNGSGKTTLLKALWASRSPCGGDASAERLLYLPQELPPGAGLALLAALRERRGPDRTREMNLLSRLGTSPEALLRSAQPSPGEARKLMLVSGMCRGVSALLLDEPTNHLDLPSIEALGTALQAWPDALVLITHDEGLAAQCTTTRWTLKDGRLEIGTG